MPQRILFRLTDSHLLVGNTGRAFSKEGFEAICYPATSTKRSTVFTHETMALEPKQWVDGLRTNRVETFNREPNALHSAGNLAQLTASDYAGRLFLEMLQNAIDAGRGEQIGYKGIGFGPS
jgi:hypothetical protein